jgi:tetratricopeptide (TPR) repeat protein
MLDEGERKLIAGDVAGAAALAQKALAEHTENPGRAQFLLARASIMSGNMEAAEQAFTQAAKISHSLRTISWSHIYLGRLADLQGDRTAAITEYQAAIKTRDGRPDTKQAAEAGLKAPFAPPQAANQDSDGQANASGDATNSPSQGDSSTGSNSSH